MKGNQRCENCRYYESDVNVAEDDDSENPIGPGHCRLNPPGNIALGAPSEYPDVFPANWCGQWVADEPDTFPDASLAMARAVLAGDGTAACMLADRLMELGVRLKEGK